MIAALLSRVKGWMLGVAAAVALLVATYWSGRSAAKKDAEHRRTQDELAGTRREVDAYKERNHVEETLRRQRGSTAAERLRNNWSR